MLWVHIVLCAEPLSLTHPLHLSLSLPLLLTHTLSSPSLSLTHSLLSLFFSHSPSFFLSHTHPTLSPLHLASQPLSLSLSLSLSLPLLSYHIANAYNNTDKMAIL